MTKPSRRPRPYIFRIPQPIDRAIEKGPIGHPSDPIVPGRLRRVADGKVYYPLSYAKLMWPKDHMVAYSPSKLGLLLEGTVAVTLINTHFEVDHGFRPRRISEVEDFHGWTILVSRTEEYGFGYQNCLRIRTPEDLKLVLPRPWRSRSSRRRARAYRDRTRSATG